MRAFIAILFVLLNVCLIESTNRTEGGADVDALIKFKSDKSDIATGSSDAENNGRSKSGDLVYEEYDDRDDSNVDNFISQKRDSSDASEENPRPQGLEESFPNEVFLNLRNLSSGGNAAFRGFTHKNDIEDLQASATDNVNVTANDTGAVEEPVEVNQRALRDAGHPPIAFHGDEVYPPFKPNTIDNADFSDCARQGEWKPIGVDSSLYAHSSLDVSGGQIYQGQQGVDEHAHGHHGQHGHGDILESVGTYPVANKIIPHWHDNFLAHSEQLSLPPNHQPFLAGTGEGAQGTSGFGSGSAGHGVGGHSGFGNALSHHSSSFSGGSSLSSAEQFQKIKSSSMLSPPPLPPIMLGKKPSHLKSHKSKHKFHHDKRKRPSGSGSSYYGFGGNGGGGSGSFSGHGGFGSGHVKHGGFSGSSSFSSGFKQGGFGGYKHGFNGGSGHKHGKGNFGGGSSGFSGGFKHGSGGFGGSSSGFKHGGGSFSAPYKHGSGGFGGDAIILTGHIQEGNLGLNDGTAVFSGHIKDGSFGGDTTVLSGVLHEGNGGFGGGPAVITGNIKEGLIGDSPLVTGDGLSGQIHTGAASLHHLNQESSIGLTSDNLYNGGVNAGSSGYSGGGSTYVSGIGGDFGGHSGPSDHSNFNNGGGFSNIFTAASATDPKDILHYDGSHSSDAILIQPDNSGGDSGLNGFSNTAQSTSHGYDVSNAGTNVDHSESASAVHYDSSAGGGSASSYSHGTDGDSSISGSGTSNGVIQTTSEDFGYQSLKTTTNLVHDGGSGGSGSHVGALAFPGGDLIFGSAVLLNGHPGELPPGDLQSVSPHPPDFSQEAASANLVTTTATGYGNPSAAGADNLITGSPIGNFDHVGGGSTGAVVVESGLPQTTFLTTQLSHGAGDDGKLVPDSTYLPTQSSQGTGSVNLISDSTYISGHVIDGDNPLSDSANLLSHGNSASSSSYLPAQGSGGGNAHAHSGYLSNHGGSGENFITGSAYYSDHGSGGIKSGSGSSSYHTGHGGGSVNSLASASGYLSGYGSGGHSGSSYFPGQGNSLLSSGNLFGHSTKGGSSLSGSSYSSGQGTRGGNSLSGSSYLSGHGTRGGNSQSAAAHFFGHGTKGGHGNGGSFLGPSGYRLGHGAGGGNSLSSSSAYHSSHEAGSSSSGSLSSSSGYHSGHGAAGGSSASDSAYLSTQVHPGFVLHAHGVLDDSSTFTCGKHHDHNTNYHTATFQVADNDYPSSVDIIKYHGDAAVIVRSDAPFQNEIYPERKNYNAEGESISGDENTNAAGQQDEIITQQNSEDGRNQHGQIQEVDGDVSVAASQFNINNRKPQTFSQESEQSQPFSSSVQGDGEQNGSSSLSSQTAEDVLIRSEPPQGPENSPPEGLPTFKKIKFHQRPEKPHFFQKSPKNLHQGKSPFPLKQKPYQFQNKQNYNPHESRGNRYIPLVDPRPQGPHFVGAPRIRNGPKLHRYSQDRKTEKNSPKVVRVLRS